MHFLLKTDRKQLSMRHGRGRLVNVLQQCHYCVESIDLAALKQAVHIYKKCKHCYVVDVLEISNHFQSEKTE